MQPCQAVQKQMQPMPASKQQQSHQFRPSLTVSYTLCKTVTAQAPNSKLTNKEPPVSKRRSIAFGLALSWRCIPCGKPLDACRMKMLSTLLRRLPPDILLLLPCLTVAAPESVTVRTKIGSLLSLLASVVPSRRCTNAVDGVKRRD